VSEDRKTKIENTLSLILNIDTALDQASVSLGREGMSLGMMTSEQQKDHASWLHVSMVKLLADAGFDVKDLEGVAVSIGPGSYTGLRVGLSAAKGLCYSLKIPLISVGTLEIMAFAAKDEDADLLCPMIDARRMEVFTAVYDKALKPVLPPQAMVVDKDSFSNLLATRKMLFFGNGSEKLRQLILNNNAIWGFIWGNSSHLSQLSYKKFLQKEFADLAYTEPLYIKEFYSHPGKTSV
jgi:tRNA threonylcarbamoyladenosine biosynthesis protein TsaB